jgi:hypothetical protein
LPLNNKPSSILVENNKKKKTTKLTKSDVNQILIYLELNENLCIRSYDSNEELRDLILSYTKAVSEYLSKQNESVLFCEKSVEKCQTKISKDGHGFIHLWKEMLENFPLVSSDQAQAICSVYPSPLLLLKVSISTLDFFYFDILI